MVKVQMNSMLQTVKELTVEEIRDSDIIIKESEKFEYGFGLIFKLVRINNSRFVALSRRNLVFSFDENGYVLWSTNLEYLQHLRRVMKHSF